HLPWGIEASPILQFGSARPYNPVASNNMLNLGGGSDANALIVTNANPKDLLSATKLTPLVDVVDTAAPKPKHPTARNVLRLDLAEAACYYSGNCHISPYNSMRGEPYADLDARLGKNFKLGEHRNLQLMFQAFNLFNHANYGNSFDNQVATLKSDH